MPSDAATSSGVALLLTGKKTLELVPREPPAQLQPHQVMVKIKAVGVCGSDISYWAKVESGKRGRQA